MIKLLPDPLQKEKMRQFSGTYRSIYNKCVELNVPFKNQKKVLRNILVKKDSEYANKPETMWLRDMPMELKDAALSDYCKAVNSNLAKKKIDPSHEFELSFKSKKSPSQSIHLRTRDFTRKETLIPYPTFWKIPKLSALGEESRSSDLSENS